MHNDTLTLKIDAFDRDVQLTVLRRQLAVAVELDLPVLLHCRGAFEDLLAIVHELTPRLRGVIHAFSRGPELAQRFIDAGFYVALGGAVTRPGARVRAAVKALPLDRVLLETDAPSIGLDNVPPEHVEPHHVADVAAAVAALRETDLETVARVTTANAEMLFRLTTTEGLHAPASGR